MTFGEIEKACIVIQMDSPNPDNICSKEIVIILTIPSPNYAYIIGLFDLPHKNQTVIFLAF
jgi:hypothetical protein